MASIIPGYEYDIFISYRQNDNRSGWVTEFVEALQEELAATIKEPLSVYFDASPHIGLLETHNVNKSLEVKLKCLIFMPVISQTYCDQKSFAWQHEFTAFNRSAKEDQFGIDIKLAGGNVAGRILPVKIHELDTEDNFIIENELGGALRCIEFIYKSAGVNRPLNPNDNPDKNLNNTYYRDQVNKIANAIKEIIVGLKNFSSSVSKPDINNSSNIPGSNPEPIESIAVLAFANMSGNPGQEFFSDGISEEIINMLAQVPGLKVAGRTSAFSFKGKNQDLRLIGDQLNVNHILEGSVRKSGNKIRITAQLIKVADGHHLWSGKYDRELEDIFDIQDEISLATLNAIKINLFGAAKEAVLKKYTDNMEAYQLYLQGRFYYHKYDNHSFKKAIELLNAAIKIEPGYALAYAGIAYNYFSLWFFNYLSPEISLPHITQALQRSIQLDDAIAESHLVSARIKFYYERDFAESIIEFKKAIELNPNIPEAHVFYALVLGLLGNDTEAVKHATIADSLDPFSLLNNFNVAAVYMLMEDYEKELEYGRRLVELEPNYFGGHFHVGVGLTGMKRYEEAEAEFIIAVNQNYGFLTLGFLGLIYGVIGEKVKVLEVLEKMEILKSLQTSGNCEMGIVNMAMGEFDDAFRHFEKAIEMHDSLILFLKSFIRYFPEFEKDPRTKQLFEKMGLPY